MRPGNLPASAVVAVPRRRHPAGLADGLEFKAPLLEAPLRRGVKPKVGRLLQAAATKALRRPLPAAQRCGGK
jgi:hypothetical protein